MRINNQSEPISRRRYKMRNRDSLTNVLDARYHGAPVGFCSCESFGYRINADVGHGPERHISVGTLGQNQLLA